MAPLHKRRARAQSNELPRRLTGILDASDTTSQKRLGFRDVGRDEPCPREENVAKSADGPQDKEPPGPGARVEHWVDDHGNVLMLREPCAESAHIPDGAEGSRLDGAHPLVSHDFCGLRDDKSRFDWAGFEEPRCRLYGEQGNHGASEYPGRAERTKVRRDSRTTAWIQPCDRQGARHLLWLGHEDPLRRT